MAAPRCRRRRRLSDPPAQFPAARPAGLRLRSLAGTFHRLDGDPPDAWSWEPFQEPRHRFDSAAGLVRVRYASTTRVGAARERYRDTDSFVPADHASHHLVTLTGRVRVLDLRREATLDALGLDDQISTSRAADWWDAAHRLTDAAVGWWGDRVHGFLYRSRTTPERSTNLVFLSNAPLEATSVPLGGAADYLDELVVAAGFTVDFPY